MKSWRVLQVSLVLLMSIGLLAACSSTPPPSPEETLPVAATDVTQQPDVRGVEDHAMHSEQVPDHLAVSGLQRIQFEFDQFTLTDAARATLAQNAAYLKANSGLQVVIEGHCDDRGSDEYNLALGERRAMAAKNYLTSLGIAGQRLSIISYGEEKPLDSQANEAAWAANRRAEFKAVR